MSIKLHVTLCRLVKKTYTSAKHLVMKIFIHHIWSMSMSMSIGAGSP